MSTNRRLKRKSCAVCGEEFMPTGSCAKYCSEACKEAVWTKERLAQKSYDWQVKNGVIQKPGAGTGHNQRHGIDNPAFKPNAPHRYRDHVKEACERCGSTQFLVGHHKNRKGVRSKRPDNRRSNIETLCKSCHQKEHEVHKNFVQGRAA